MTKEQHKKLIDKIEGLNAELDEIKVYADDIKVYADDISNYVRTALDILEEIQTEVEELELKE